MPRKRQTGATKRPGAIIPPSNDDQLPSSTAPPPTPELHPLVTRALTERVIHDESVVVGQRRFVSVQDTDIVKRELTHRAARVGEFARVLDIHMMTTERAAQKAEQERMTKRRLDPEYHAEERVVNDDEYV